MRRMALSSRRTATFVAFQPTLARWLSGSPVPAEPSCLTMCSRKKTDRAAAEAWLSEPVTVRLFRDNGSYKEDKVVTVNGETVRIPRGEDVIIPRRFALVLAQGEAQDARTGALIERETARFAAESGALGL